MDKKRSKHYWELAAMNGDFYVQHNLGILEADAGNYHRAYKHFIVAAKAEYKLSMKAAKEGFMHGLVTEDEYANTFRTYQQQHAMKSNDRDECQ